MFDEENLEIIKNYCESENIEYEEKKYCFGCSWDTGVELILKSNLVLNGKLINKIDIIHGKVKFMYDQRFILVVEDVEPLFFDYDGEANSNYMRGDLNER